MKFQVTGDLPYYDGILLGGVIWEGAQVFDAMVFYKVCKHPESPLRNVHIKKVAT